MNNLDVYLCLIQLVGPSSVQRLFRFWLQNDKIDVYSCQGKYMKEQILALYLLYIESLDGSPEVFFGKIQDFHHGTVLGVGTDSVFWLDGQN